ncbi:plasmid partitioning/stability family protein [Providencia rettgeri]|nr:plasmid partitioning/stability family protein [Providencia rettgeri]
MSTERKKFTLYLHPENDSDNHALDVIESVPRSRRGEFYREALISGIALNQLDSRLPTLLAALFTNDLTADEIINVVAQTTGWKPSYAKIEDVVKAITSNNIEPISEGIKTQAIDPSALEITKNNLKNIL